MTANVSDWVGELTTTVGSGDISLGGQLDGYAPFDTIPDGEVWYAIIDGTNRESGKGVLSSGGTILERTDIAATLTSGRYISEPSSGLELSGLSNVYCTFNAEAFDGMISELDESLKKTGGEMTGSLVLYGEPTVGQEAATKSYVDKAISGAPGGVASINLDGPTSAIVGTSVFFSITNFNSFYDYVITTPSLVSSAIVDGSLSITLDEGYLDSEVSFSISAGGVATSYALDVINILVLKPNIIIPISGATGQGTTLNIRLAQYSTFPIAIAAHTGTIYQVATEPGFNNPVYDSGVIVPVNPYTVPFTLESGVIYYMRVKFISDSFEYYESDWSDVTGIATFKLGESVWSKVSDMDGVALGNDSGGLRFYYDPIDSRAFVASITSTGDVFLYDTTDGSMIATEDYASGSSVESLDGLEGYRNGFRDYTIHSMYTSKPFVGVTVNYTSYSISDASITYSGGPSFNDDTNTYPNGARLMYQDENFINKSIIYNNTLAIVTSYDASTVIGLEELSPGSSNYLFSNNKSQAPVDDSFASVYSLSGAGYSTIDVVDLSTFTVTETYSSSNTVGFSTPSLGAILIARNGIITAIGGADLYCTPVYTIADSLGEEGGFQWSDLPLVQGVTPDFSSHPSAYRGFYYNKPDGVIYYLGYPGVDTPGELWKLVLGF